METTATPTPAEHAAALGHDPAALELSARWKQLLEADEAAAKKSAAKTSLAIQNSPLKYEIVKDGEPPVKYWTRTLAIPKLFTQEDKRNFEALCHTFSVIFDKTIDAYKADPAVRKLFGFRPEIEAMIVRDPGYAMRIPMLRIDIFYNEETKDWQVCEFNTDGTSAMFENDTMYALLQKDPFYQQLHLDAEYLELSEKWADAFEQIWKESGRTESPRVVITDFLENAYLPELQAFVKVFEKRGWVCELEDIRHLDYDGQQLYSTRTGTRYNMVYRRAVTSDVERHWDAVQPFLQAAKDGAALLVGDFQTQIVHSKQISEALQSPQVRRYLTPEEIAFLDAHMPWTRDLSQDIVPEIIEGKDGWIIKPRDSYGAKGVWAGVDIPKKRWEKLVRDAAQGDYIIQTYIPHYRTSNIDAMESPEFRNFSNMSGLYVYNGQFAGVYSRLSDAGIISTQYNEKMVPTLFLKEEAGTNRPV